MLRGSHFSHDSVMDNNITLSCNVLIGGHSYIMEGVNMGLGAICHQFSIIGHHSIIGMGGIITKKSIIYPGRKYVGNPVRDIGRNDVGLQRANLSHEDCIRLEAKFKKLMKID